MAANIRERFDPNQLKQMKLIFNDVFVLQFIGSLEIARPTCKIDIITAMRRIRVNFIFVTLASLCPSPDTLV